MNRSNRLSPAIIASGLALLAVLGAIGFFLLGQPASGQKPGGAASAAQQAAQSGRQLYYSTMHPWIVQDHPGSCPICGMDLVKMSPEQQADYLKTHPG